MLVLALLISAVTSGAAPRRCEADFARFSRRYIASSAYQRAHALPRILYSAVVNDADEPHTVTRELRTAGSTVWQVWPRERRDANGLQVEVRNVQRLRAEILVANPDTDWQIIYRFARRQKCWALVEVDDRSL